MTSPTLPPGTLFALMASSRLWSFDRLIECVDDFVPHARDQMLLRRQQELINAKDESIDELDAELELTKIEWSSRFPAHFYGNLVVLLSAELEIIFGHFAAQVREAKALLLAFDDIAGPSPYSRLRKYTQVALNVALPENSMLEDLYFLRNIFAHHGGEITHQSDQRKRRIEAISRSSLGVSVSETYVIVSHEYLYAASDSAGKLARTLSDIHPQRG